MITPDMGRFLGLLHRHNQFGDLRDEALRHEMTATLNRNQLTNLEEGGFSFNTTQLCWIVSSGPTFTMEHQLFVSLLISALIEDRMEIFRDAQICGVVPVAWTWVAWADGFAGTQAELLTQLATVPDIKGRCGAACLATRRRPEAIGRLLLDEFRLASLAVVYHRLLERVLTTPHARDIAAYELDVLGERLEVLFAADTDVAISKLITASTLDHPELAVVRFGEACGDMTAIAIARRHLERGRPRAALDQVKDLRFLSPAFDQAIVVAALAALECGDFQIAQNYAGNIKDARTRLQIITRLAQVTGDSSAEMQALIALAHMNPRDGQVFTQLVLLLDKTKHADLARQVCFQAQERFVDDPLVEDLIKRHIA
jgi:hypothetical protein